MALVKCPECQREVSDSAVQCPGCGYSVKEHFEREARYRRYEEEARAEAYEYVKELARKRIEAEQAAEVERLKKIREEEERKAREERNQIERQNRKKKFIIYGVVIIIATVIFAWIQRPNIYYNRAKNIEQGSIEEAIMLYEKSGTDKALERMEELNAYLRLEGTYEYIPNSIRTNMSRNGVPMAETIDVDVYINKDHQAYCNIQLPTLVVSGRLEHGSFKELFEDTGAWAYLTINDDGTITYLWEYESKYSDSSAYVEQDYKIIEESE